MSDTEPLTILSVDDNDAIRYSFSRYLREDGYEVIEARTGAEALVLARREPALITLDINLPDMDGYEICRRLKDDPATRDIPILHISASCVDASDRVRGLEGGADAYLAEPVNRMELLATVKALLRMRQAQRESRRQASEAEIARKKLQDANETLETRVRQRTAELERERREVQELSSQLLQAQDEERRRISRDLHDSTGQLLVALTMNLARLKTEQVWSNPGADALIDDTTSMVDEMSRQLRTMSYLLHPPMLDEAGLLSAVKWYIDGFSSRSSVQVSLDCTELGRLPAELEITLFRLVQESLTNIHRHSESKTATIRLNRTAVFVTLEVIDQGKGFDQSNKTASMPRCGVGILGMKERVRRFGGTIDFSSGPGGTTVKARLPVQLASKAENRVAG
ncbi:MAG TPA: response regulator [Candidatus Acidoferrales bacterium]|jgi:signal transduction histidine kinase|nr:response regulator [Candidatus Acidoferrales bacterium]